MRYQDYHLLISSWIQVWFGTFLGRPGYTYKPNGHPSLWPESYCQMRLVLMKSYECKLTWIVRNTGGFDDFL